MKTLLLFFVIAALPAPAADGPKPLSPEQQNEFLRAAVKAQNAHIAMLLKSQEAQQAKSEMDRIIEKLKRAAGADGACQIGESAEWMCPAATAEAKKSPAGSPGVPEKK